MVNYDLETCNSQARFTLLFPHNGIKALKTDNLSLYQYFRQSLKEKWEKKKGSISEKSSHLKLKEIEEYIDESKLEDLYT